MVQLYFKYESAGKCRRKVRASFQENLLQVDEVYSTLSVS